jgi:hypothetical protein
MSSQVATAVPTIDAKVLAEAKIAVARDYPEGHPFRAEIEALSADTTLEEFIPRIATLVRLSRRARP